MKSPSLHDRIRSVRAGIRARQPIAARIELVRKKVEQRKIRIERASLERPASDQ